MAALLVNAINGLQDQEETQAEMVSALENCLQCEGLDWSTEHEAAHALRRARERRKRQGV